MPKKEKVKLIDQPRPWATIVIGTVGNYRWRGVPAKVRTADMVRVHEARQRARHTKKVGD